MATPPIESNEDVREECDHEWRYSESYDYGDPNGRFGADLIRVYVCDKCGEEKHMKVG